VHLPQRLRNYLLALMPAFPPVYAVFALAGLFKLPALPRRLKAFLLLVAGLQFLAALATPQPLVSLALAAARMVLIYGLMGMGLLLASARPFVYLLAGLSLVYISALVVSLHTYGYMLFDRTRLIHPYYNSVSLGLAAALGLLIIAVQSRRLPWALSLVVGSLAAVVLLLSGSRGALVALLAGSAAAALLDQGLRRRLFGILGSTLAAVILLGRWIHIFPVNRLLNWTYLSNRDVVWKGALDTFLSHVWGGVGPYQLGLYLHIKHVRGCHLSILKYIWGPGCRDGLGVFDVARVAAHNTLLHSLAETGVIGTAGWLLLYGLIGYAVWRARDPLIAAIFFGFMAMGFVDNPTLVPSYSLAETFWIAAGVALAKAGLGAAPAEPRVAASKASRPPPT